MKTTMLIIYLLIMLVFYFILAIYLDRKEYMRIKGGEQMSYLVQSKDREGLTVSEIANFLDRLPAGFKQTNILDKNYTEFAISKIYYDEKTDRLYVDFTDIERGES